MNNDKFEDQLLLLYILNIIFYQNQMLHDKSKAVWLKNFKS